MEDFYHIKAEVKNVKLIVSIEMAISVNMNCKEIFSFFGIPKYNCGKEGEGVNLFKYNTFVCIYFYFYLFIYLYNL